MPTRTKRRRSALPLTLNWRYGRPKFLANTGTDTGGDEGFTSINYNVLCSQLERLVAMTDLPIRIPESQHESEFHSWFEAVLGTLENMVDGEAAKEADNTPTTVIDTPGNLPAELANRRGKGRGSVRMLSNKQKKARGTFLSKMRSLQGRGVPPRILSNQLRLADRVRNYDLVRLDGFAGEEGPSLGARAFGPR